MSEIKGQILGIIIVLAIFGSIAGVLMTLFNNTASNLESKLDNEVSNVNEYEATFVGKLTLNDLTY